MNKVPQKGDILFVRAKPKSSSSSITWDEKEGLYIVYLTSIPEDNKANEELKKLFKKELKVKIDIISGMKSKKKKIIVL